MRTGVINKKSAPTIKDNCQKKLAGISILASFSG
jgi:hypothetical protein